jgi:hypothetical protein
MQFIQPDFYNEIVFSLEVLKPETVNTQNQTNVVTKVHFLLKGTYQDVTYEHQNELEFFIDDIDLESITAFADLTEQQVKTWIEDKKPMDALKHTIATQIKEQIEANSHPSFSFQTGE